ncbi:MAG: tetratricopeptide repeat protein [Sphingomonadales bacterium]
MKNLVFFSFMLMLGACSSTATEEVAKPPFSTPLVDEVDFSNIEKALESGNLILAKNLLEQAALAKQGGAQYELLLAEFHLANGSPQMSGAEFTRLLDEEGIQARVYQGLGLSLIQTGDFAGASEALLSATQGDAQLWRAWNALGVIYDREADYEKAQQAYAQASAIQPNRPEIINNLGFSYLLSGDLNAAIDSFSEALRLRNDLGVARTNLRLAMALKGDYVAALAGANAKELRALLNNAGVAALSRGDFVNAEALLNRAMEKSPSFYALAAKNLEMLQALKETESIPE